MPSSEKKLKVFLSYSRADAVFADELASGLEWAGYDITIDRASIVEGEDWRKRLGALIADADTIVFLLSPSSAQSKICAWEVDEAARLSKRIIPVLVARTGDIPVPERLAALNYVRFDPEDDGRPRSFIGALRGLQRALDTDLEWLREHTRLMARATEWDLAGRVENRLLRGSDVDAARRWTAERPKDAPALTELHLAFIRASESAERNRTDEERKRLQEMASAQAERSKALDDREIAVRTVARRTVLGIAGTAVFAIGAGATGYWAFRAQRQSLRSRAQEETARKALSDKQGELAKLRDLTRDESSWRSESVSATPLEIVRPPAVASDAGPAEATWAVRRVGADRQPCTGAGVTVAVIDSGIDIAHPAFAGIELVQKDFTGEGHGDQNGHGTMMASIIAGRTMAGKRFGLAPGISRLVMIKFLGSEGVARMETLPIVLDWALNFDGGSVDVVCLGFGLGTVDTIENESKDAARFRSAVSKTLTSFVQSYRTTEGIMTAAAASGKGALIFSAAGNDNSPGQEVRVNSPTAMARGVISVSAAEERAEGLGIAGFSNLGATLAAPGTKVVGARPGSRLTEMSGTSIACAVAAGTAALWWEMLRKEAGPGRISASMVWSRIKPALRTDVFGPGVKESERGLGLVQAPAG
jgi:hypothetical protein